MKLFGSLAAITPVLQLNPLSKSNFGNMKRRLDMTMVVKTLSKKFGNGRTNTVAESTTSSEEWASLSIGIDIFFHLLLRTAKLSLKLSSECLIRA